MGTEKDMTHMYFCLEGLPFIYGQAIQELTADDMTDDALGLRDPGDITIEGFFSLRSIVTAQLMGVYRLIRKGTKLTGRLERAI